MGPKSKSKGSNPTSRRDKPTPLNKNGKKSDGPSGSSFFTWFMIIALLGVWTSVAVVWFDLVDYEDVLAKAKEFRYNLSEVLQGKLGVYDADGDGDFDMEDAKVLLGLKERAAPAAPAGMTEEPVHHSVNIPLETAETQAEDSEPEPEPLQASETHADLRSEPEEAVEEEEEEEEEEELEPELAEETEEDVAAETDEVEHEEQEAESEVADIPPAEPEEVEEEPVTEHAEAAGESKDEVEEETLPEPAEILDKRSESEEKKEEKVPAKKKKPKLLNKFDKTIKAELDAAEKLRKKGKTEEALKAFNELLSKYPQSPRAKYGKGQSEDDLAEKMRSNEMLQKAINTYGEVADMPNPTTDLVKIAVKRQANRQQFLGHIKRSVVTLQKLTNRYPSDVSIKNELGVSYLLLGDNNNAKRTYEEVLALAPNDGFAKVHYGFILKAANQIAESIPYLKEGLESEDPGTDDGRFYFHLGDALQRMGDKDAYKWYELGHQRGHFASVWQRSLYNVNGLKAQPWWTTREIGYTDLVKTLERNWKTIRDEGMSVMDQEKGFFLPEDENLREKGNWGQFTLWQQGRKNENSCKHVPRTCALLEKFPESTGCKRGQVKYSIMQPGTHVWPHTGPTNCRLRMHLGLVIPKGCRIRCANDTREWKEGKVVIFDDSFEHEVWQDANSYRLIFIVDVWHPELTPQQRRTLSPI